MSEPAGDTRDLVEPALGALVLFVASAILAYLIQIGGLRPTPPQYALFGRFGEVGGLAAGAPVRLAGVRVGAVSQIELDPKTYMAVVRVRIDRSVRVPSDSTMKIASDGLLGGAHVSIAPGAAAEILPPGGEIPNTQGAVDLFGLIGQAIRPAPAPPTS